LRCRNLARLDGGAMHAAWPMPEGAAMRAILWMVPILALGGCGGSAPVENIAANIQNEAAPDPGPMLGGVRLNAPIRAAGTNWSVDLAPGTILYTAPGSDAAIDLYPVSPRLEPGRATFPTQTPEGERVAIVLREQPCGTAPLTAEATVGARVLRGCAGPLIEPEAENAVVENAAG
jgi:uncharacterized membrane protein